MRDDATHEMCPDCDKGRETKFSLLNATPKFDHIEGEKLKVEYGPFQGNFFYHVWVKKGIEHDAMRKTLEKLFAPEYVEWVPEVKSWCVTLPIEITPKNQEFYMKEVPGILASI